MAQSKNNVVTYGLSGKIGDLWIYTATRLNGMLEGDRIVITASDLPGNVTTEEQTL
jgi:hypothetical protein